MNTSPRKGALDDNENNMLIKKEVENDYSYKLVMNNHN